MRSKLLIGGLGAAVAFLLATSPVVAQAAGFITSGDIVNSTIKSKDVKNNGLKGKDIKEGTLETVPSATTAGNATNLAGKGASSYLDDVVVYRVNKGGATASATMTIPLAVGGSYDIAYSAYMIDGSGSSGCYLDRNGGGSSQYVAEERDEAAGADPAFSGSGVVTVAAGETWDLYCYSGTNWTTASNEPIQIVVTPLDSVTNATLAATRADAGKATR